MGEIKSANEEMIEEMRSKPPQTLAEAINQRDDVILMLTLLTEAYRTQHERMSDHCHRYGCGTK